ncbi:uncharacterized protein [Mytilus edulis]|uniref:uncharacterized protein n=1 Tax=Mytilus edulis TaxID=6550 RepID=UPI0039EF13BC
MFARRRKFGGKYTSHVSAINASETVLVISFPIYTPNYDAFMMTIPGIQHYKSYYNFTVPTGYTSFISVKYRVTIVNSRYDPLDGFKIDNRKLDLTKLFNKTINDDSFATLSQETKDDAHEIHQELYLKFGLWIYGERESEGYGYPSGMAIVTYVSKP